MTEDILHAKTIPAAIGYAISPKGNIYNKKTGRMLKPYIEPHGYLTIKLEDSMGIRRNLLIHRLIYSTHVAPIPKGMWVNHKDGNKTNNSIDNLELTTPSENHLHASQVLQRKYARGLEVHTAKLNQDAIDAVKTLHSLGWSQSKIARAFGVTQPSIHLQINKGS